MAIRLSERLRLCVATFVVALLAFVVAPAALAQTSDTSESAANAAPTQRLETARSSLDEIEAALNRPGLSVRLLAHLRAILSDTRDRLRGVLDEVEPRFAEIESRLKELGPAPARGTSEDKAVANEREQVTRAQRQFDAARKQARLLTVRAEQLQDRLTTRRQGLYTQELLERSPSLFDPQGWTLGANAFATEWRSLLAALPSGGDIDSAGWVRLVLAALLLALIAAAAIGITKIGLPRLDAAPKSGTRFARARTGLLVFLWLTLRTPGAIVVASLMLEALGLLTPRLGQIVTGLAIATLAASFGRGAARGLLAPDKPARRLMRIDDGVALAFHDYLVWSTRLFGAVLFLQTVHKTLGAPVAATVATNAVSTLR